MMTQTGWLREKDLAEGHKGGVWLHFESVRVGLWYHPIGREAPLELAQVRNLNIRNEEGPICVPCSVGGLSSALLLIHTPGCSTSWEGGHTWKKLECSENPTGKATVQAAKWKSCQKCLAVIYTVTLVWESCKVCVQEKQEKGEPGESGKASSQGQVWDR